MSKSNPSPRSRIRVTTRLLGVFLLALLTSACTMRGLVGLDVEADGSGTFSVTIALDEELRTLLEEDSEEPIDWTDPSSFEGEDSPADLVDEFPEGASISPYTDEDFEGFTVDVAFSSLEELEEILAETSTEGEAAFPLRVTEDSGRFELTATDDLFDEAAPSDDEMDMFSDAMLQDLFDFRLEVSLPGEIVSTNADETSEDGVMVWQMDPAAEDPVRPSAVSETSSSILLPILVALGVLLAGGAVAAAMMVRRRSSAPTEGVAMPGAEPQGEEGPA